MSSMSTQVHNKSVTNTVHYDEYDLDTSIPAQTSSIPLVDCSSEDESWAFSILPQASSTASQSYTHDDGYSENMETAQDSDLTASAVPPITEEPSCIVRGSGGVQSTEAGHNVGPDFLTPMETPTDGRGGDMGDTKVTSITLFQESSNVQIKDTNFITTGGNATFIQFGDDQFTEIQRNSICDYIANLKTLPDINHNFNKHMLTHLIISLPRAEAVFSDYQTNKKSGPCFEGTRVALLREMADWVTSSDESRMYVLSGLAGIGKSTVAYTIASRASDLGLLGASFFFSRDEDDRKNAKKFFTTIAYQLCVYDEIFAKTIGDVLLTERGSAATTKDPREQLQVLILEPLRSIVQPHNRPILVVVDALDECDEADEHAVFRGLCQLVQDLPSFKVILTTRPQPSVEAFLSSHGGHKLLRLQDIEDKVVNGDIQLYLNYSLSLDQARKRHPRWQWYACEEEINSLVHAAGRLFIVASTAVRYILDKTAYNPANQMKKLLCAFAQARTPFKDLDQFYTVILRNVVPENCDDDDISSLYQSVVGAIILVQHPLPVSTLTHVINIDVNEIRAVLDKLQSVILVGDDDVPRIYHKSFPDYVMDQGRCKDPRLQIYPRIIHTQIATHCFEIMDKYLKYNILGLSNLARFMKNEDGLKEDRITDEQLEEKIPQQLRYACVYWDNHLRVSNHEDVDLINILEKFLNEHLLHWLEVLSLIGRMDSAHYAIGVVLKIVKSTSLDLDQLLSDALRFISKFYEIIERSALHTYYSALGFTPTDSILYHRYSKEAADYTCVISGGPEKWDTLVADLDHEEDVGVIKFSLDSSSFVSCSKKHKHKQGKLKIWNATTGTPISVIPGHRFAIANDFSTVASSEDSTISYYNVNGSARNAMFTTSSTIYRLALSSESNRIAAALDDGTVLLWDSRNSELIGSFKDFRGLYLQFSPTGTRLAYSSLNGIAKLQDGISGKSIADLQCGSHVWGFESSGDGSRIATLSQYFGLRLWNSESGALIDDVIKYLDKYLAISANGSLLATANDSKVKLWSENHGRLAQIKVLELDRPKSITFSVDNILAIANTSGIQLYDVKTHSFISTLPFKTHSFISILPFNTMAEVMTFSPDCTRLAVSSYIGSRMYLWDIRGMDTSSSLIKKKSKTLTALVLSRDCSQLACGFSDGTIKLWRTDPTTGTKQRNSSLGLLSKIKAFLPRVLGQFRHDGIVMALGISPDGKLLASRSYDGTIKLWNSKDGLLRAALKVPTTKLQSVALSNSMLVAGSGSTVTLWNLDASPVHTFRCEKSVWKVSIAENNALIAIAGYNSCVELFDVVNKTTIATFDVPYITDTMTFLPNNSHLVVQSYEGVVLLLNLIDKHAIEGPTLEHLIQLPNIPIWHGVPIWHCMDNRQHYISALFPQHKKPVPVLWIPKQISVAVWAQGSSMIALGCTDGRVIFLSLPTRHAS